MNAMRGAVPFEVDGQEHYLRLTTNAQARYQERAGESVIAAIGALRKQPDDVVRLRRLFWAAASHMPGLTEDGAGDLIDALGSMEAARLLGRAFTLAFPPPAEGAEGNGGAADRPKARKTAAA